MKALYIIAVTGGIACGKTVVSYEIRKYGAEVVSADHLVYNMSNPGQPIYNAYVEHFGEGILQADGRLDRRSIACLVFNDPLEKQWVDQTTHPMILSRIRQQLVEVQERGAPIAVLDVPLLFEAGWEYLADEVWVVWLQRSRQFRRLMYRNRISYLEAFARINAQMDVREKRSRADVAINNSKNKYELKKKVQRLMLAKFPHLTRQGPSIEEEEAEYLAAREAKKLEAKNVKDAETVEGDQT